MLNNQPRSFKFYRKNEEEVMRSLGLKPTKNYGIMIFGFGLEIILNGGDANA